VRARLADGDPVDRGTVVVPVPGHEAGVHRGPRLALARELARALDGLAPDPPPLRRLTGMASARSGLRRDHDAEVAGLAWDDAAVPPGAAVLLVDDVLASGATLDAAVGAVHRDAAELRTVRALVLAVADRAARR
jgi:adenine/guanine phosphoribosyltransferase-like PRPP-binding protein